VKPPLVIGCGNTIRGDDAAGIRAAEAVGRARAEVDVLTVHGPVPDLAEQCAGRPLVVFVDASTRAGRVVVRRAVGTGEFTPPGTHSLTPEAIAELSRILYGEGPGEFWIVEIPAADFSFGEALSARTGQAVREATTRMLRLLDTGDPGD
jgi:hydrogenase maturation protease